MIPNFNAVCEIRICENIGLLIKELLKLKLSSDAFLHGIAIPLDTFVLIDEI